MKHMIISAFSADVMNKKTIAYWSFDEGKGEKVKDLANGNIGNIQKAEWVKGVSGSALKFNGKDARVIVENSKTLHSDTGDLTMTGGRLKRLSDYIKSDTFLFTYGDGISNVNLKNLIKHHKKTKKLITLTAVRPPARFGALKIKNGNINNFRIRMFFT